MDKVKDISPFRVNTHGFPQFFSLTGCKIVFKISDTEIFKLAGKQIGCLLSESLFLCISNVCRFQLYGSKGIEFLPEIRILIE